jgi:phosphatidylglycerol:prolipoprotein diacylglycerol transferase
MLKYPSIDPVLISLGPLQIHWYGIMYLLGFAGAWWLAMRRSGQQGSPCRAEQVEDLIVYGAVGVILGGRCGYVIFYHFDRFVQDPVWLLRVWEGGMSFHGGLLGVALALLVYSRKIKQPFFAVADFVVPMVPIGLGLGRLGNFIGQELWGRATDAPWAMVFPRDPEQLARHPSQLYQAALEGLVLFLVLLWFSAKPRPRMAVSGLFLMLYGSFRFAVEFVREPDGHIGFDALGWMTRGQLLSTPMIALGVALFMFAYLSKNKPYKKKL